MMPFLFLAIGFLLIFFEFFLPGGILGIAGGALIILSVIFFSLQANSAWMVILYVAVTIVLLIVLTKAILWRMRSKKGGGIFLDTAQEGYVASHFDKELIGQQGVALSDLKPAGHILVNGKRVQAVSKMGYLKKGTKIEVISGDGAHLIVRRID